MTEPHAQEPTPLATVTKQGNRSAASQVARVVGAITLGLVLGALLSTFAATAAIVDGRSMEPALRDGDLVLVLRPGLDRLIAGRRERTSGRPNDSSSYLPGDVVALSDPGWQRSILKRVVAVGPATVAMSDGSLLVDGRGSSVGSAEGYKGHSDLDAVRLAAGELFVLGDNRRPLASRDSRHFGPVSIEGVRGRIVARLPLAGLLNANGP